MNLNNLKKVYCVGIGGIGLSAVVRMFVNNGINVEGSDSSASEVTHMLEKHGVVIHYGQDKNHVPKDADLVLYSKAIPEDNPDLVFAKEQKIKMLTYPEILGAISRDKKTIQVIGTHGKTTTTAMTATTLILAGIDPTVIVGSFMNTDKGKTNYIEGNSEYFVLESCEYKRSFRHIDPFILVITNIEEDHLDYYKDLADIQSAFRGVIEKVPQDGVIICNPNDPKVAPVIKDVRAKVVDYTKIDISNINLKVPGVYNQQNAQAVVGVAEFIGVEHVAIKGGLESFRGTWRRFEYKGEMENGAILYDDYAHHPTEVRSSLSGFRERFPDKKITLIFHPHLYSRIKQLKDDFITELSKADEVILAPIFPAREPFDETISSSMLAEGILKNGTKATAFDSFDEIISYAKENTDGDNVVVTMGAGDIYKISQDLLG
jgi:UDP-N-acetylmuramate--alanine ligase